MFKGTYTALVTPFKDDLSVDEVAAILDRLGSSAEIWGNRIQKLFSQSRLLGSYFTTDRQRLRDVAARRGVHHLDNLASCPSG